MYFQVKEEQRRLRHKLTPENAYFKAKDFNHIECAPKEELHQFLICLYSEHMLPATLHKYKRLLCSDLYSTGVDKNGNKKHFITKTEVKSDYAAHFYDMYVKNHDGKHMTGKQIKILLLNLPFMLQDLILPEVMCTSVTFIVTIVYIVYDILYDIVYNDY